ncbi:MAG TPA: hypothetical protein VF403_21475, partial [Kofleriaceae bacterium]
GQAWRELRETTDVVGARRVMASIGRDRSWELAALVDGELRARVSASLVAKEPLVLKDLAITGNDLMQAGFAAGRQLGELLGKLLDRVLVDPTLNTRDQLLALAKELA